MRIHPKKGLAEYAIVYTCFRFSNGIGILIALVSWNFGCHSSANHIEQDSTKLKNQDVLIDYAQYKEEIRRMKKIVSIAIILCLAVSIIAVAFPANASTELVDDAKGIDVDTSTRKYVMNEAIEPRSHHSYWNVGETALWSWYDGFYGGIAFSFGFMLRYADSNVEIWVQTNLDWGRASPWTGTFPYGPEWRSNPPKGPTDLQLQYLASEWGNKILPNETNFFGAPLTHDGTNAQAPGLFGLSADYYTGAGNRQVILVCNIRDENYYLPNYGGPGIAYPYKIIGVSISDYEDYYYDRNVVTIDAISFDRQLGPPGYTWPGAAGPVTAPYAYESTVAHEYQHLLHHELCPGDVIFMNEGCSMYAEFLCGYGLDPSYPNSYFYTPDNSLTEWGDQGDINILADYGAGALWTLYLSDRFGAGFLQYYFNSGGGGIDGINAALAHFKYKDRFDDVYRDWKLANLIRADFPGCHKYNYQSINFNDPAYIPLRTNEIGGLPVPVTKGTDFGNTITILGYDTGISKIARYGSDYITFENWNRPGFMYFDGDDYVELPVGWTMTANVWWSGTGVNMQDTSIVGSAAVSAADPTLTLVTKYSTEPNWDFGFVQVSTDSGATWTSLSNAYTTSDYFTDVAAIYQSMPGLTGPSLGYPSFTTMSFDLTAYAGKTVQIRFRYMTDEASTVDGWWIQSATVSGNALTLALPLPPKAKFQVTVLQALVICKKTYYLPYDMMLTNPANKGMTLALANKPNFVVLIVTPTASQGLNDYQFQVTKLPLFKFC
jgi:hypothetical protein